MATTTINSISVKPALLFLKLYILNFSFLIFNLKLTIPKKTKREVRQKVYHILSKGLFVHQKNINSYDPIYLERLLGYLYFWYSVEPENSFVLKSIAGLKKYSKKLDEENTLHNNV
jgi:hypothetical protein